MKTTKTLLMQHPITRQAEHIPIHSFQIDARMSDKALSDLLRLIVKFRCSIQDTFFLPEGHGYKRTGNAYATFLVFVPECYLEEFKAECTADLTDPVTLSAPDFNQNNWMCLVDGSQFWPFQPDPRLIKIEHIAHCLANLCRYSGHTKRFYSVAEHAFWCSYAVPAKHALEALMHDASEAYCADLPSPIKRQLPAYQQIEDKVQHAIARRFGLEYPYPDSVHKADKQILANEYRDILNPCVVDWCAGVEPLPNITIQGWLPTEAKHRFLERYYELLQHNPPMDLPVISAGVSSVPSEEFAYEFFLAHKKAARQFEYNLRFDRDWEPESIHAQHLAAAMEILQKNYTIQRKDQE
jgi:uncharacterized protein